MRNLLANLIPHNNKLTVAPPGKIQRSPGKPIMIASLMRSGTHILIDLILNNFSEYKRKPLYIDADQYLKQELPKEDLLECGGYVIKTHFPQGERKKEEIETIKQLAKNAFIISPKREFEAIYKSLQNFKYKGNMEILKAEAEEFEKFWQQYNLLSLDFKDLVNENTSNACLNKIADFTNSTRTQQSILPPPKNKLAHVLSLKLKTRLLGNKTSPVNTSIGFAKKS